MLRSSKQKHSEQDVSRVSPGEAGWGQMGMVGRLHTGGSRLWMP